MAVIALFAAAAVSAQGIQNLQISGNTATATVSLPVGLSADLTLTFEQATNLGTSSLGLSAAAVDALALAGRLPANVSLPGAFPVRVTVEPPGIGGLTFDGVYTLALHTVNLQYTSGTPLRLYAAHGGGSFEDITDSMGAGSYRVRGTGGSFSEFLILVDARTLGTAITAKLDAADALLTTHSAAIPSATRSDLADDLAAARAAYGAGNIGAAIAAVDAFAGTVREAGSSIPNRWQASGGSTNVAGLLRAAAATLRFSLDLATP